MNNKPLKEQHILRRIKQSDLYKCDQCERLTKLTDSGMVQIVAGEDTRHVLAKEEAAAL